MIPSVDGAVAAGGSSGCNSTVVMGATVAGGGGAAGAGAGAGAGAAGAGVGCARALVEAKATNANAIAAEAPRRVVDGLRLQVIGKGGHCIVIASIRGRLSDLGSILVATRICTRVC
jgi:hypothetical protein